jgi:6-pyruvoyltetrahydropterin/6-carboxytetrahydropterin synthase
MITCTKAYTDLPFAHRQPSHDGHCAWIHGHNWSFVFTFAATTLDACGFVIDFGKLGFLKAWIAERFDHTLVLNYDDPELPLLRETLTSPDLIASIFEVPDCSSEGLAAFLLQEVNAVIQAHTGGRVSVARVEVVEDSKNSATATP